MLSNQTGIMFKKLPLYKKNGSRVTPKPRGYALESFNRSIIDYNCICTFYIY